MKKGEDSSVTWRKIAFEDAYIEAPDGDFYSYLVVDGIKPYANMRVELIPLVYAEKPEYWGIEIVGCLSKFALPAITPYENVLPLDFELGTKGIEVFGAEGKSKRLEAKFGSATNPDDGGGVVVLVDRQSRTEE